jgi:hypothetical protein
MKINIDSSEDIWFWMMRSTMVQWEAHLHEWPEDMMAIKYKLAGFIFRLKEIDESFAMPSCHPHQRRMNLLKMNKHED